MTQKTDPFIGSSYGWDEGENGWGDPMNENILQFSFLHNRNIDGIVSSLPPSPANGEAYFNTTDNLVYYRVDGIWYNTPISLGFELVLKTDGSVYSFNGTGLVLKPDLTSTLVNFVSKVATIADLTAISNPVNTQTVEVVSYYNGWAGSVEGPVGGGMFVFDQSSSELANGVTVFGTGSGRWKRIIPSSGLTIFDAGGRRDQDIQPALQALVNAAPSTYDITSAYIYEPSWVIKIPYGNYFLSGRVLIAKNNIVIKGDGMFNTNIYSTSNDVGDPVQVEMIRFRGAYACGLYDLTLDGGLPFNLSSAVSYGCRIPLVLDQVAHFAMDGVNVCNYRTRGIQCIHVWESKFGEIRCFNGWGFTDSLGIKPGGLMFDAYSKEENFFSGAESNQIYIEKYAFSGVGCAVSWEAPCFNVVIEQAVWEGRTYSAYIPNHMDSPKIYISGASALCGIKHAWVYFHDQPFASNALFIQADNAGMGCYFENIHMYQENVSPGSNFSEIVDVLYSTSAFPIDVDLKIQDIGTTTNLFRVGAAGSTFEGSVFYRNSSARTLSSLMGTTGQTNFSGKVTMSTGAFSTTPPTVYNFKSISQDVSAIDNVGIFPEYKCRATANFNGAAVGGIRRAMGFSSITRTSTGVYAFVFSTPMPDTNYTVIPFCQQNSSNTDHVQYGGGTVNGFTLQVENSAGVAQDTNVLMVSVYR